MNRLLVSLLVAIPIAAGTAGAQSPGVHSLEMSAQLDPRDGGAAIELANAYWRDGQTGPATRAYRRALALDNVMMETRAGPIWSHEVATRMLASQPAYAAR